MENVWFTSESVNNPAAHAASIQIRFSLSPERIFDENTLSPNGAFVWNTIIFEGDAKFRSTPRQRQGRASIPVIKRKENTLHKMRELVEEGYNSLLKNDFDNFGKLLHENWPIFM